MIEDGISKLVQADPTVMAICPVGGFYGGLPKGMPLPTWSYIVAAEPEDYTLTGRVPLSTRRLQINLFAADGHGVDCLHLARAIDNVLSGFRGVLPDAESTNVQGCFRADEHDTELDPESRTYRRILEFYVNYDDYGGITTP